jgi:hypothetical protein
MMTMGETARHPAVLSTVATGLGLVVATLTIWSHISAIAKEHRLHDEMIAQTLLEIQIDLCDLHHGRWWRGSCVPRHR